MVGAPAGIARLWLVIVRLEAAAAVALAGGYTGAPVRYALVQPGQEHHGKTDTYLYTLRIQRRSITQKKEKHQRVQALAAAGGDLSNPMAGRDLAEYWGLQ